MPSKYRKGEPITDVHELIRLILAGHPIYWNHKVQTQGWMVGQQLHTLTANMGRFWKADRIEEKE